MREIDLGVCRGQVFEGDPDRVGVLLPGAHYVPAAPLLWFTREALVAEGWTVVQVWDEWNRDVDADRWVAERFQAALDHTRGIARLVVAKSITTLAIPAAAERSLPGIWLTPLLQSPEIRQGLQRTAVPTLLVGGTGDSTWDSAFASGLQGVDVLEFEGADHALQHAGEPARSIGTLATLTERVREYAAALG